MYSILIINLTKEQCTQISLYIYLGIHVQEFLKVLVNLGCKIALSAHTAL